MQVSSPYWQQVIGERQQRLQASQQQGQGVHQQGQGVQPGVQQWEQQGVQQRVQPQGVQLVQSEIAAGFWELCDTAFRPSGSGGICLGAVE